ncbi:ABC-type phosphate transport system, permease component [Lachnospiraceae bacterium JC7]|nr:ABC-type phosphate transport system, permease component [Lachnospiraceae bacterium JC7]
MKIKGLLIKLWAYMGIVIIFMVTVFFFAYIFLEGHSVISREFIFEAPSGMVLGSEGGIFPAITGSLAFTLTAVIIGSVPAVSTALYVVYFCKKSRMTELIHTVVQCFSGIPSIVLGLFSYSLFVRDLNFGRCILSGGIALGIMILPFIEVRAEKTFRELDPAMVRSAYALGCTKTHTIWTIVLPACRGELFSGIILGGCYAMGATAPMIFTGAVAYAGNPTSLFKPAMALPLHLYLLVAQGHTSLDMAYGTAFVMMAVILFSNILVTIYARRRHYTWNQQ